MKLAVLLIAFAGVAHADPLVRKDVPISTDAPMYDIDQAIDDASGRFSAKLTVRYTNTTGAAQDTIPLLLHPNASRELGAPANSVGSLEVTDVAGMKWEQKRPTLVLVHLPQKLATGAQVTLSITYKGQLRNLGPNPNDAFAAAMASIGSLASSGTSDYGLLAMGDGLVTLASAYPMIAPWRDGAFDTSPPSHIGDVAYNHPATFHVRTVLPAGMTMVSNLVDKLGKVTVSDGAMVRDFVMVAGRDLKRAEKTVGQTRVTSIFREKDARGGKLALDAAASALKTFERRFGPYPYTELDIAESSIVGGAGGVEFCGLTLVAGSLYRDPLDGSSPMATMMKMLGGLGAQLNGMTGGSTKPMPSTASLMDPMLEFTVAHEVAHQWFAEMVGNDSRRFPMVDEPMAQYAAALAMEERHGAAAARSLMDQSIKMNYALYRLLGGADRSVMRETTTYATSIEYAGLVYGKAPYLYVALRKQLGDATLDKAIKSAVAARRFQLSSIDDWIDALEQGAGPKSGIRAAFQHWFAGTTGDQDLKVDDSGDFVIGALMPPDVAKSVRESLAMIGMKPKDLMSMLFGGGIGSAPTGPGIDVDDALQQLLGP